MEKLQNDANKFDSDVEASELLKWCENNKKLKVQKFKTPIEDLELNDIKIANRMKEDEIFLTDKEIYSRIRRGNCIAQYSHNGEIVYKIARRGLIKFFDYLKNYPKSKKIEKNLVLEPVEKIFKDGGSLIVYITEKANGENAQISYFQDKDAWIIASKNVTIACRTRQDIQWYLNNSENPKKFSFCAEFAELWFQILEREIISKNLYQSFLKDICGYTLVCENVGITHQHIKLYTKNDLIFYGLVLNESSKICDNVENSFAIFKKYNLSVVDMTKSEVISSKENFLNFMAGVYDEILKKDVLSGGEGSVAYFTKIENHNGIFKETIVSMGKLKTFEYRFLRKLREKISNNKKKKLSVDDIMKKIERESKEILGQDGDELELSKWLSYARFVLDFLNFNTMNCDFSEKYANFTLEMTELFQKNLEGSIKVNEELVNKVCEKYKIIEQTSEICLESHIEMNPNLMEIKLNFYDDDGLNGNENLSEEIRKIFLEKLQIISKNNFKKGGLYFFLNFGLVGGGKSTFFSILEQIINQNFSDYINLMYISSDKIKENLIKEYMIKHPGTSEDDANEKISKGSKAKFNQEIFSTLNDFSSRDKINIYYIDKNFPSDNYESFYRDMMQYDKKMGYEVYVFHPYIRKEIDFNGLKYPFSINYFMQCYYRILGRKHETLDFDKNPYAHHILIGFLALNREFRLKTTNNKIFFLPISYSDEKYLKITHQLMEKFVEMMKIVNKYGFNKDHMMSCTDKIDKFFDEARLAMPVQVFEDTRPIIEDEIMQFLKIKIFGNK